MSKENEDFDKVRGDKPVTVDAAKAVPTGDLVSLISSIVSIDTVCRFTGKGVVSKGIIESAKVAIGELNERIPAREKD